MSEKSPVPAPSDGRVTKQRTAIWRALEAQDEFLSAQQLHQNLQESGQRVSLATTYRIVQALADLGELDVLRREDGESIYRRCEREEHHHHLLCRGCGKTIEIQAPAVEKWASSVAAEHGYANPAHTVEISGLCPQCQRQR